MLSFTLNPEGADKFSIRRNFPSWWGETLSNHRGWVIQNAYQGLEFRLGVGALTLSLFQRELELQYFSQRESELMHDPINLDYKKCDRSRRAHQLVWGYWKV